VRVKDNQPRLRDALFALCEAQPPVDRFDSVDRHAHGREEHRRVEVFAAGDRLDPDWRPFIACVVRITRRSLCRDTRTGLWPQRREIACYACQIPLDAKTCAAAIRGHCGMENRNHHSRARPHGWARTPAASGAGPASSPACAPSRSTSCAPTASPT
jgi:hypothetical protein